MQTSYKMSLELWRAAIFESTPLPKHFSSTWK